MKKLTHIFILAAGKGTRMKSSTPKILHKLSNKTLIKHCIDTAKIFHPDSINIIVGHDKEKVINHLQGLPIEYIIQEPQLGSGHAIQMAVQQKKNLFNNSWIIILSGDAPFLPQNGIKFLANNQENCFLSMHVPYTNSYGKIIGGQQKNLGDEFIASSIKEAKDCSTEEKEISIVNSGIYKLDGSFILEKIFQLNAVNKQKEIYLTDLIKNMKTLVCTEIVGVNTMEQMENLEKDFYKNINLKHMSNGVRIQCIDSVRIDPEVTIDQDVIIGPQCTITATQPVTIKTGTIIEQGNVLHNTSIGSQCLLKPYNVLTDSDIGNNCSIGPFTHLRPGSKIGDNVKLGNFVEIKKSTINNYSQASHLSYIGDAEIGKNVNIGCGFITCNYDGFAKHKTIIKDNAFIGSDVQINAPCEIGENVIIASGSTITTNIPNDALAIARTRQENKDGYAPILKNKFKKRAQNIKQS